MNVNLWLARILSAAVALGALLGSSAHLYSMAAAVGMSAPWAPPLGLDAVAIVAAAVRRVDHSSRLARWAMGVTVALSTFLQGADTWTHHPNDFSAVVLAVVPPLAAWGVFELFMAAVDAAPAKADAPAPAKPRPKPAPRPAPPASEPEVKPTPIRPPRPEAQPLRPAARSLDELVVEAVAVADRRGVIVTELSQRTLRAELGIGDARARELSRVLKDGPEGAAEVVGVLRALSSNGARP